MRIALLLPTLAAAAAAQLANPSFEEGLDGWTLETGAQTGEGPSSRAEIDREVARDGAASLRLSGDGTTRRWLMAGQRVACAQGARVLFSVAARCRGLRPEGRQYRNANAILLFADARGGRTGIVGSPLLSDDRDWIDLDVHALAPEGTASVTAAVLCSVTGTVWWDDARLRVGSSDPREPGARALAYEALRRHVERTYPYFDLPGKPGPDALAADPREADVGKALLAMLSPLKDIHVWIETPFMPVPTVAGNPNAPNWSETAVRGRLTQTILDRPPHLAGRIGDLGYVRIGAFAERGFAEVEAALDALADARALVLDVRPNGGGDERLAWRIAGRFAKAPVEYGSARSRDPTLPALDAFLPPAARRLEPLAGRAPDTRRVAVLQGPYCVSSTEWFLLMMGALENVTTVGLASRGATGNPKPFPLFPGVNVHVPTQRGLTPSGDLIEGRGIPPDIEVKDPAGGADPALEKAIEILRG